MKRNHNITYLPKNHKLNRKYQIIINSIKNFEKFIHIEEKENKEKSNCNQASSDAKKFFKKERKK